MGLRLITPPAIAPVSIAELRKQLEIGDDTAHDAHIGRLATRAAEMVERYTRRSMITQQYRMTTYWREAIELPRPPLQSIESVSIIGIDESVQVIDPADYVVQADRFPGVVLLGATAPTMRAFEPVVIDFTAGYGDDAEDVPEAMRQVMLQLVTFWFEVGRGDVNMPVPQHIMDAIRGMSSGMATGFFRGLV